MSEPRVSRSMADAAERAATEEILGLRAALAAMTVERDELVRVNAAQEERIEQEVHASHAASNERDALKEALEKWNAVAHHGVSVKSSGLSDCKKCAAGLCSEFDALWEAWENAALAVHAQRDKP